MTSIKLTWPTQVIALCSAILLTGAFGFACSRRASSICSSGKSIGESLTSGPASNDVLHEWRTIIREHCHVGDQAADCEELFRHAVAREAWFITSGSGAGWKLYELVDGVEVHLPLDRGGWLVHQPHVAPRSKWVYTSYGHVSNFGLPAGDDQVRSGSISEAGSCDSVDKWDISFEALSDHHMLLAEFETLLGAQIGRDAVWSPNGELRGIKAYELLDGTQVLAPFELAGVDAYRLTGTPMASCGADWQYSGRGILAREPR